MNKIRPATLALLAATLICAPLAADAHGAGTFKARLTAAQARLGLDLIQRLSAPPRRPIVAVSPAGIAGAAGALDLGASPQMREALHGMLGFAPRPDGAADDMAMLRDDMARLATNHADAGPLRMSRSIAFDRALKLQSGVTDAMRRAGVGEDVVDFSAPAAVETINRRVRERTGGRIGDIVDRLSSGTSLVVLDAMYFEDRWKTQFDRARTRPEAFKRVNEKPIAVATMHLAKGHYLFRQDAHFVGIELPFADERFRMVIVTTQGADPAPATTFLATDEWLEGKGFMQAPGELAMPHFAVSSRDDLTAALDARGLGAARLAPDALSGFTPDPVRVTRVVQRLELRLNEEGTEVAAATAAVAERGLEGPYVRMVVDKPFVFALRDTRSGLILATGYVGEPGALATAARP
jgi:serpin B